MKRFLFCLTFISASLFASANPLFFPSTTTIVQKGDYEYYYDQNGVLLGYEDTTPAGSVYRNTGNGGVEVGYYCEDNGKYAYYASGSGNYMGSLYVSYKTGSYWDTAYGREKKYSIEIDTFVDKKNRPVATYQQTNVGLAAEIIEDAMGVLRALGGETSSVVLKLQGSVRRYNN